MTTPSYTTDTSAEALEVQLACLRAMSPQERIRRTCAMSKRVRDMGFAAIRRRHPEFSEEETQLLFIELTYGKPLADDVRRWKAERSTRK
jgi:hypothetical protein